MRRTKTRRNSSTLSNGSCVTSQNLTSIRQNADMILYNCQTTLQELLRQTDVSSYSVEELFGLISQQYEQRQNDLRQMGKLLNQATDMVDQSAVQRCSLLAQIERDSDEHRIQIAKLRQLLEDYQHEVTELKENMKQTQLQLIQTHEQKDSLHDLYQATLIKRTSIVNYLPDSSPLLSAQQEARLCEINLLELEVKQLKTELNLRDGVISQKQIAKSQLFDQIKQYRSKVVELQHQNQSLRTKIGNLQDAIQELEQKLKDARKSIQKLDKTIYDKIVEPGEEQIRGPQSPLKRASSLFTILKRHDSINSIGKQKMCLAIEIGSFQFESHTSRSNTERSQSEIQEVIHPTTLEKIVESDGDMMPESPIFNIKTTVKTIQSEETEQTQSSENISDLQLSGNGNKKENTFWKFVNQVKRFINQLVKNQIHRHRKGNFYVCN